MGKIRLKRRKSPPEPYCYGKDTVRKRECPPEPSYSEKDTAEKEKMSAGTVLQ